MTREVIMTDEQNDEPIAGNAVREGLSWSWHLDLETVLAALSEPAPWNRLPASAARPAAPVASTVLPDTVLPDTVLPDTVLPGTGPSGAVLPGAVLPGAVLPGAGLPGTGLPGTGPSDAVPPSDAELTGAELTGAELTGAELTGLPVDPVEADFADYLDAVDAGRSSVLPLSVVAGRVAEVLPVGPDLAAWLAGNPSGELEDGALAGAAVAYRRLAAWAQAGELAVVAQMASRSAAADGAYGEDGVGEDGRPGKIPADVHGQVSLALTMSQAGAQWWTGLAVDL